MIEAAPKLAVQLFQPTLLIAALALLGFAATRSILGSTDWKSYVSLSLPLGSGLITWILFLMSWAGIRLEIKSVLISYLLLLGLSILAMRRWSSTGTQEPASDQPEDERSPIRTWGVRGSWLVIGILTLGASVLSVGLSYYSWDAIANWSIKGYGMALEGSVMAASRWGAVGLSYPLNQSLLIGLFHLLNSDPLPGSKLLFPLFYLALLLGVYRFLIRRGVRALESSLAALLLATTPIIFQHATIGYANLLFSLYLCLGILWIIEGWRDSNNRMSLLGGFLLALSIWTRPEGIFMSIGVAVTLLAVRVALFEKRLNLPWVMAPQLVVASFWLIFTNLHATQEAEAFELSGLAVAGLLQGDIRWDAIWVVLRFVAGQVLRFRDWGFVLLAAAVMVLTTIRMESLKRNRALTATLLITVALSAIVFGSHYMAAYSPRGPGWVYEWLSLNFNRLMMPVGILLVVIAFLALAERQGPGGRVRASSSPRE